ncbi:MAG TPA: aminoacyl-tRNA hydrolase [Polyangiaceae bacterium]|nr:aminoacyl-tRNA hydrolase [Polyangiaceae bacterium]
MILLVGLGNPGPQYAQTRHNVGFMAVDAFCTRQAGRVAAFRSRFEGQFAELARDGERVAVLKPETFMNASGRSVRAACAFLGLQPSAVLVVHDELDIPFGDLRIKSGGGDGGHRGLRSITAELSDPGYGRLRVGIGRPPAHFQGDVADFVLQAFALEERSELTHVLVRTCEAIEAVITDGLARTMNRTNQRTVR